MRQFKYIGKLPPGYDYRIIQTEYIIKIIGVHPDKVPIGFILNGNELEKIEFNKEEQSI